MKGEKPQKFYVVFRGRQPGIYRTWSECDKQVTGFPCNKHKSYSNRNDAYAAWNEFWSKEATDGGVDTRLDAQLQEEFSHVATGLQQQAMASTSQRSSRLENLQTLHRNNSNGNSTPSMFVVAALTGVIVAIISFTVAHVFY